MLKIDEETESTEENMLVDIGDRKIANATNHMELPTSPRSNSESDPRAFKLPPVTVRKPNPPSAKKFSVYNPYKGFADENMPTDQSVVLMSAPQPAGLRKASVASAVTYPYNVPNIVTINVSGIRYQTQLETLESRSDTLLGNSAKRDRYWNPVTGEYFFDRHRASFEAILFFYQSGGFLFRPTFVPLEVFHEELKFFQMPQDVMVKFWADEGFLIERQPLMPMNEALRTIWKLMEYPSSSTAAKIMSIFSLSVILFASFSFMLETVPRLQPTPRYTNATLGQKESMYPENDFHNPFYVIEVICIVWFTAEFWLRLGSCPSKTEFVKSFFNWVDFLAIVPFYITLLFPAAAYSSLVSFAFIRILRLMRVLRILKVVRYSRGLQILGLTFKAGFRELILLAFIVAIMDVIFASAVYIAEYGMENSQVNSIPEGLWYCIVTMTTNGYGDFVPVGTWGRLVGGICAVSGVCVIALPIPVVIKNFKTFYKQEYILTRVNNLITRQDQRVRLVLSGENALKK